MTLKEMQTELTDTNEIFVEATTGAGLFETGRQRLVNLAAALRAHANRIDEFLKDRVVMEDD